MLFPNYKIYLPAHGNLSFCRLKAYNVSCTYNILRITLCLCCKTYRQMHLSTFLLLYTFIGRHPNTLTNRVKWVLYQTNSNINYIFQEQISIYPTKPIGYCVWLVCLLLDTLHLYLCHSLLNDQRPYTFVCCQYILFSILLLLLWSIARSSRLIVVIITTMAKFENINCRMTFERAVPSNECN